MAKIIATLGPATDGVERIRRLMEAGLSVARLNFSHGAIEEHARRAAEVRTAAAELGVHVGLLGDLQGPKIRIGPVPKPGLDVPRGALLIFERDRDAAEADGPEGPFRLGCTYGGLVRDVRAGQRVLINDGAIRALAVERKDDGLTAVVTQGGLITSSKGINLPDTQLGLRALTDRDRRHVRWAVENELDFLALSFVRDAEDIDALRKLIREAGGRIPIIAKIELPAAVRDIENIAEATNGIMVARGDLGVEMDLAEVPVLQKELVAAARRHGTPCIVATQMFESMIEKPAPTRAEVSDVATALFDGADAVMLSGETAVGAYPVLTVEQMRRVVERTGQYLAAHPQGPAPRRGTGGTDVGAALAHGVWTIAQDIHAASIVVWSEDGRSARDLSRHRFGVPIIAATSDPRAARWMNLLRDVQPWCLPVPETMDEMLAATEAHLDALGVPDGSWFILAAGDPLGVPGMAKRLSMHRRGD